MKCVVCKKETKDSLKNRPVCKECRPEYIKARKLHRQGKLLTEKGEKV